MSIERVRRAELLAVLEGDYPHITEHDRDEMAIPSYLHANPLIRWLMWRRYETVAALAELEKSQVVCEFGCGPGMFLPHLHNAVEKVYAVDLFPEYAKALVAHRGINVEFASSFDDLPDGSLDLLIAADVLEHITDLDPYLTQFARKLKPTGRFVVSGPTENFVYKIGRLVAGFGDKGDYHHTNIHDLNEAIERFGFRRQTSRNLPFAVPPHLFNVSAFAPPEAGA